MESADTPFSPEHRLVVDRFVAACAADERVVAGFLRGSYAGGAADEFSDLDLGLITTDAAFDEFLATRDAFVGRLGEALFLEDFDSPATIFFIFAGGVEAELSVGRQSAFSHIHVGPYRVLLDKLDVMAGTVFAGFQPTDGEQVETLRRLVYWFWHDVGHFVAAIGRGHLWWAYGQLEVLRGMCVDLARLRHDFSAPVEHYDKVHLALPIEQLAPLRATFCPMEVGPMLSAALIIVRFYQGVAPDLARAHGIAYPTALDQAIGGRLEGYARRARSSG